MIAPRQHYHGDARERHPVKLDRWLVGLLAGAALMYLAGRALGLGRQYPDASSPRALP